MILKREEAYRKIREAIMRGYFKPGERLVESELTEWCGLGRMPVREALRQLEAEGYIAVTAHKGAIIRKISLKEIEDAYDTLSVLEGFAVETAARNLTAEALTELGEIENAAQAAVLGRDNESWFEINARFHDFFYRKADNAIVSEMIAGLRRRIYRFRSLTVSLTSHLDLFLKAHDRILTALKKGDPRDAGMAMQKHIQEVKSVVVEVLKNVPWF